MKRTKAAFLFSSRKLSAESLYMWTFTFAETLSIKDTRKRWNHLLTLLKRRWPNLCGLRFFELHESHGLHVHLVTNRWINVNEARGMAMHAGWGRIHVQKIPLERAAYLAKYLSKDRPPCFRGWRLWAGFGNWDWTRVKDLLFNSRFSRIYRACKEWLGWQGNKEFFERIKVVARMEFHTVCNGWPDGCGPNGTPYQECSHEELLGGHPAPAFQAAR